jgi:hypothetical protein
MARLETKASPRRAQDYFSSGVVSSDFASATFTVAACQAQWPYPGCGGMIDAMRSKEYEIPPHPRVSPTAAHSRTRMALQMRNCTGGS